MAQPRPQGNASAASRPPILVLVQLFSEREGPGNKVGGGPLESQMPAWCLLIFNVFCKAPSSLGPEEIDIS